MSATDPPVSAKKTNELKDLEQSNQNQSAEPTNSAPSNAGSDLEDFGFSKPKRVPYLLVLSLTVLTVMTVNGLYLIISRPSETPPRPANATERIKEQLELVHAGKADGINIADVVAIDEDLEALRDQTGIRTLIVDEGIITDAGMSAIGSLTNLVHLRLRQSPISDEGLKQLLTLQNLRVLNLPQADISAAGIESLAALMRLRQLRVGGNGRNDISRMVSRLGNLRAIHLINVPVTDESLKLMCEMPHLESLYLDNPSITELGWDWMFATHPEIHIHVNQSHHDRDPNWHSHANGMELEPTITDGDEATLHPRPVPTDAETANEEGDENGIEDDTENISDDPANE